MSIQLPLPGNWPHNATMRDAGDELERLARDKLDAKAEVYEALERLAKKHDIPLTEVNGVMLCQVDDALGDLTYDLETSLRLARDEASDVS
jgi:hypothetical protein